MSPVRISLMILTIASLAVPNYATATQAKVATVGVGTIKVEREGRTLYLKPGGSLYTGDLLTVKRGDRATVRCNSNQLELIVPNDGLPRGISNFCS